MKALLIVDMQNDFLPGGALAVKEGDTLIPLLNTLQSHFSLIVATKDWHPKNHISFASQHGKNVGDVIRVTPERLNCLVRCVRKWARIISKALYPRPFYEEDRKKMNLFGKALSKTDVKVGEIVQKLWPDHCVQGSFGAEFCAALDTTRLEKVFYKGTDSSIDSYSAFFDNARLKQTGLAAFLKEKEVKELFIVGLATDYCVKYTVLDACSLGFQVTVIQDGCRGVELNKGDCERALKEMRRAGARLLFSNEL